MRGILAGATTLVLVACTNPAPGNAPPMATTDVSVAPAGEMAHLTGVRLSAGGDTDRLEFQFADRVPGHTVGYRPLPAHEDASGLEIPLPGATALLMVTMNPATAAGWGGGTPTYTGPFTLTSDTGPVTEARLAGDFEAVLSWVVGLRSAVPFSVRTLEDPPRLIVEIAH